MAWVLVMEINKIYHGDSYKLIKDFDDKSVDLIFTDPPYGIKADKGVGGFGNSPDTAKKYNDDWDNTTPSKEFFNELLRVGKKVIIFGGNYFTDKLPQSNHWIVWDKQGGYEFNNPFSACELLWTNANKNNVVKYIQIQQGFIKDGYDERVHPTQKPLDLCKKIILDYTNKGDIVLDTFSGSGTIPLACKETGRYFIGIEKNKAHYDGSIDRLNNILPSDKKEKQDGILSIYDFMGEQE